MNKLLCPLCKSTFCDPCMCPHCSQVYCNRCIKNYLDEFYFCPSCDTHVIELIDCSRLINQVQEKIKESDLKKAKGTSVISLEQCIEHGLPLKYHCLSCKSDICSDCGLISQKHKGHNIQPIENIKPTQKTISQSQLRQIKERISQKLSSHQQQQKRYLLQVQLLKSQIKYNKTKIYEYYEELIARLEKETQFLLKQIEERMQECIKQISEKMGVRDKIEDMERRQVRQEECYSPLLSGGLTNSRVNDGVMEITDRELYKYLTENSYIKVGRQEQKGQPQRRSSQRSNKIAQRLSGRQDSKLKSEFNRKSHDNPPILQHEQSLESILPNQSLLFDKKIYDLGIMKQIYPEYYNFSFEMDYIAARGEDVVYSPVYKVYGYDWRLKVYPKGNAQAHGSHLSLFLQLINSPQALSSNTAKSYTFRLQLLNLNQAGKSIIKEYTSKFSVGQCWGYAEFIETKDIREYLHDGKLLFVMGVKNVSYYDECESIKRYVGKLEGEVKVLQELCEDCYLGDRNRRDDSGQDDQLNLRENLNVNEQGIIELELNSSSSSLGEEIDASLLSGMGLQGYQLEDDISSIISSFDGERALHS